MKSFSISEFKARFSEIIEQVRSGEEITLTDNGENLAIITPSTPRKGKGLRLGAFKDETLIIHDDFEMSEKEFIDRAAAFAEIEKTGKEARARWEAEGLTNEDIEKMIQEEVDTVSYGEAKS